MLPHASRPLLVPSLLWQWVLKYHHIALGAQRGAGEGGYLLSPVPTIPNAGMPLETPQGGRPL